VPALTLAVDEIEKAARVMSEEEVRRAKAVWRAGILMSRESCAARADVAARSAILFGRPRTKEERIAELEAVGLEDVRRVLERMLASTPTVVNVGGARPRHLDPVLERLAGLGGSRADAA
jgi:predicted Zn-dependent peptidase